MNTLISELKMIKTRRIESKDYPYKEIRYVVYTVPHGQTSDVLGLWVPGKMMMPGLKVSSTDEPHRTTEGWVGIIHPSDDMDDLRYNLSKYQFKNQKRRFGSRHWIIDLDDPKWDKRWMRWYNENISVNDRSPTEVD